MPLVDDVVAQQCRLAHATYSPYLDLIEINSEFWKKGNYWQKRKVLYHELGHRVGLDHPVNPFEQTIMNTYLETAKPDGWNWDSLFQELRERYLRK